MMNASSQGTTPRGKISRRFSTKAGNTRGELQDLLKDTRANEVIVYYAGNALALSGGRDVVLLPSDAEVAKP